MRIYKAKDYEEMSQKAANIIAAQVVLKPECVLGLATGIYAHRYLQPSGREIRQRATWISPKSPL